MVSNSIKVLIVLLFLSITAQLSAFQSIVVLPFSNQSQKQEIYWLGEGFAESLSEEMFLKDAYIIQRPERKSAYDDLRLPYVGNLSRATMLKIGEKLSADYVVFGSYNLQNENQLQVTAQVIRIQSSVLSKPITASGQLENLYSIQTALKEGLKAYFAQAKIMPLDMKTEEMDSVPLHAYELYIKGLLESSDSERVAFLKRAVAASSDYTQAFYRLGTALSRQGQYKESSEWLAKIHHSDIFRIRSLFLIGLNQYFTRDYAAAEKTWTELGEKYPSVEIENNLGVAAMYQENFENASIHFKKAAAMDTENANVKFNLACALIQLKDDATAAANLKEVIRLRPNDFHAFYLLGKLLEREKNPQSKRVLSLFQEVLPTDQKGKFPEQFTTVLQLLRPSPLYLSAEEKQYALTALRISLKQRNDYVKTYQSSAGNELEKDQPDRAVLEIKKGLTWAPLDWYLHYLWAMAYQKQKTLSSAIAELEFSVWCMENIDSRLLMADIYREMERYEDSKKQIQLVLALDPKNKKAMDIWGKIWNKVAQ